MCVYVYVHAPAYDSVWLFSCLMGVFRISVHAKGLGERGGSLLYSKGRKATWSFLCLLQLQNGLDSDCLPMRSWAKSKGTDGKRKRDAAYFYSVHLLPQPFLPLPLLPSKAIPQYKHAGTWINGPLCVWSTPLEHNERLSSQRYGKYFFQIFRRLVNCSKLGVDAMISHRSYPPSSFVLMIYLKWYNTWTSIRSLQGNLLTCEHICYCIRSKYCIAIPEDFSVWGKIHQNILTYLVDKAFNNAK